MKAPFGLESNKYSEIKNKLKVLDDLYRHKRKWSKRDQTDRRKKNIVRLSKRIKVIERELYDLYTPQAIEKIQASEFFKFCLKIEEFFEDVDWEAKTHKRREMLATLGSSKDEISKLRKWYIKHLELIDLIRAKVRQETDGMSCTQKNSRYLTDSYVRGIIVSRYGVEYVPDWLLEAKREQLFYHRSLKKLREV